MRKALLLATAITALSISAAVQAQERGEGMGASAPGKGGANEKMAQPRSGDQQTAPGEQKGMRPPARAEDRSGAPVEKGAKSEGAKTEGAKTEGAKTDADRGGKDDRRGAAADRDEQTKSEMDQKKAGQSETGERRAGSSSTGEKGGAQVTSEQRTRILSGFKGANIREANSVNVSNVSVGVSLPHSVVDYWEPVPVSIIQIMPQWRPYRVVRIHNEIVIVDPRTFEIVYILA